MYNCLMLVFAYCLVVDDLKLCSENIEVAELVLISTLKKGCCKKFRTFEISTYHSFFQILSLSFSNYMGNETDQFSVML